MKWMKTNKPLEDGWYWRKCKKDDPEPDIVEVCNGVYWDTETLDGWGDHWVLCECEIFKGWLWCGPIRSPVTFKQP